MERLGFLKLGVLLAPPTGTSVSDFVDVASTYVNSQVVISYDQSFAQWLTFNGLGKHVGHTDIETKVQYWWVFTNGCNQTGWLSRLALPEYFETFTRKTGLLESDFVPSELGRTLSAALMPAAETSTWKNGTLSLLSPLVLTAGQKVFFTYLLLRCDGEFLLRLLANIDTQLGPGPFRYLDVGQIIPSVLDDMASSYRGVAFSDDDQRELTDIRHRRDLIAKQNTENVEKEGSGSSREQLAIPRLEWLVDLGILRKIGLREYEFSPRGRSLARSLTTHYRQLMGRYPPDDCLHRLLKQHLFGPIAESICGASRMCEREEWLGLARESYERMKGPMGYVSLRSLLIQVHASQAERGESGFIEYDDALRAIEEEHRQRPHSVYYTIDRLGNEHQVKFEQRPSP